MLIVMLVGGVVLYVLLYVCYTMLEPHADSGPLMSTLAALREATLMPQGTVFVIFRGLLLVTLLYIVTDALLSLLRGHRQHKTREKTRDKEWSDVGLPAPKEPRRNLFAARRNAKRELRDRINAGLNTRS